MRRLTRRQRVSAIVLAVLAACFITLDLGGGGLSQAHSGVRGTLGALYRGTDAVLGPVRRWLEGVPAAGSNEARISDLERQNAVLRGRIAALRTDRRVTEAVAALQRSADGTDAAVVPARVIAFGPGQGFDWTVTLDVGTNDGVHGGQTVTDGDGLVGRVLHSDADTCVVLLAADPGSGVGARDVRTGEIGVASGRGTDGLLFVPLDPHADIRVGDQLITGPTKASSYVAGLTVGTVRSVRTSADGSLEAGVTPAADPTSVDFVGVIIDGRAADAARAPLQPGPGTRK
ncbi:MAG TPA: rod shape-determining protein MreC [Jatrophihabitans sp.]|nr:rod shape-determining protein MreC [Jatrophihabitans sp.]